MSVSGVMNTALSGMQAQTTRIGSIAGNVANSSTPGYSRLNTSLQPAGNNGGIHAVVAPTAGATPTQTSVDLGMEIADLVEAAQSYKANAVVFETGADMWDMLMSIKRD